MIFTAGTQNYADPIIDYLDPFQELVQHRLYRESWLEIMHDETTKLYIKDLRILGNRELKNMVIVDNAVISFAYQIDNGIPIISFKDDKTDIEFLQLMKYMKIISKEDDCRDFVKKAFKIGEILKTQVDSWADFYNASDSEDDFDENIWLDIFSQARNTLYSSKNTPFCVDIQKSKSFKSKRKSRKSKGSKKSKHSGKEDTSDISQSAKIPELMDERFSPPPTSKPSAIDTIKNVGKLDAGFKPKTDNSDESDKRLDLFSSTKFSSVFTNSDVS